MLSEDYVDGNVGTGRIVPARVSPANNTSVSERDEVRYAIIMTRGEP